MKAEFGTDGVRGRFGDTIDATLGWWIGYGAAKALGPGLIAVGRDTRPSGPALSQAVIAGIRAAGSDAFDFGVVPTPALAWVVCSRSLAGGVMVTASHNPAADNGLKVLMAGGHKADPAVRARIEAELATSSTPRAPGLRGKLLDAPGIASWDPLQGLDLRGVRVVFDAANGAAWGLGEALLRAAGAEVRVVGTGEGARINHQCGALHPGGLIAPMQAFDAHIGIALDGDGDRLGVVLATAQGPVTMDGDAMLWALAQDQAGGTVVGTVMSNLALETGLAARGVRLVRTAVGDAEVWEGMEAYNANFGGEPSGHLMFRHGGTDPVGSCGLATAARLLAMGLPELQTRMARWVPAVQKHAVVGVSECQGLDPGEVGAHGLKGAVARRVEGALSTLNAEGARAVVRPSGTEPIVRVMVEHADGDVATRGVEALVALLRGPNRAGG